MSKTTTNILFIFFLLLNTQILALNSKLRQNPPSQNEEIGSEKNGEISGTLFDSLDYADEAKSDELNSDTNELGKTESPVTNIFEQPPNDIENDPNYWRDSDLNANNKDTELLEETQNQQKEQKEELNQENTNKNQEQNRKEQATALAAANTEEMNEVNKLKRQALSDANLFESDPIKKVHHPILDEVSSKSRMWSVGTLIVFGTCYLILALLCRIFKKTNKFVAKAFNEFANQQLLLIICYLILLIVYIEGYFDDILMNWEYLVAGLALFILNWFLFNGIITIVLAFQVSKWDKLEKEATNFTELRHEFDVIENVKYDVGKRDSYSKADSEKILEKFEFLVLKRFFCLPLFPLFKFSSVKKEIKFSLYLQYCLLEKIKHYFKYSWTGFVVFIIVACFWNVYLAKNKILTITIVLMLLPLIGALVSLLVYLFLKYKYNTVIGKIDQTNMMNFQDIDYNSNLSLNSRAMPKYLLEIKQNNYASLNDFASANYLMHNHMHERPPSIYENNFPLGVSFFPITLNLIQTTNILFLSWVVILFGKHLDYIVDKYSKLSYIFLVIGLVIYLVIQVILTSLILKWITILGCIEMKRNGKCLKKVINAQLKEESLIANDIFNAFKIIYFNMKNREEEKEIDPLKEEQGINEKNNEIKLTYTHLIDLIKYNISNFKHENYKTAKINIKEELPPFLKSFGSPLNENEIKFMFHLIDNIKDTKGQLDYQQLCDVYGAILHFRTKKPIDIFKYVFNGYHNKDHMDELNYKQIEDFMKFYEDLFTTQMQQFVQEQCNELGDSFSFDSLFTNLSAFRQYHAF